MSFDRDSFLHGVYTGRQLKGWTEEGLNQYHAYGFNNMMLIDEWAEQRGYLGYVTHIGTTSQKLDGILPRINADSGYSTSDTDGMLYPDWRKPFEIGTTFLLNTIPDEGKKSYIFGSNYNITSGTIYDEYYSPQAIVHDSRYFEFIFASRSPAWQRFSLELGGSRYPLDYLPIDMSKTYKAVYKWTGTQWIVSISTGEITVRRNMEMTVPHLYSASHTLMFGNNLAVRRSDTVQNLAFNLQHTYIKIDGKLIWGFV